MPIKPHQPSPTDDIILNRKIVSPEKLKILVLMGNDLGNDDLEFLRKCIHLVKLDLSGNKLTKLNPKINWSHLTQLKMLFLHNNFIANFDGLSPLAVVSSLQYLTTRDNPIANEALHQHRVVNHFKSLKAINCRTILIEERSPHILCERHSQRLEDILLENWTPSQNTQAYYLSVLNFQLRYIERAWLRNNPIIRLQRWIRSLNRSFRKKQKKRIIDLTTGYELPTSRKEEGEQRLGQCFSAWREHIKAMKLIRSACAEIGKPELTCPLSQYLQVCRNLRVSSTVKNHLAHIRRKIYLRKSVERIYHILSMKRCYFSGEQSFAELTGMLKTKRIYYAKSQHHLLTNFLLFACQSLSKTPPPAISPSKTRFLTIRMADAVTYGSKKLSTVLGYLMWPSTRIIAVQKKRFQSKPKSSMIKIKPLSYVQNAQKQLSKAHYEKSKAVYERLTKFAQNEYESALYYVEIEDEDILCHIVRCAFYHNIRALTFPIMTKKSSVMSLLEDYSEPFLIYAESLLDRACAVVRIQRSWRRYLNNKRQKESIYQKMLKSRAALRIQRFFKDIRFSHRAYLGKTTVLQLRRLNEKYFYLPQVIYMKLLAICDQSSKLALYQQVCILVNEIGQILLRDQFDRWPLHASVKAKLHMPSIRGARFDISDSYFLLHLGANISSLVHKGISLFRFEYSNSKTARINASLIMSLSYQLYGKAYVAPMSSLAEMQYYIDLYQRYPLLAEFHLKLDSKAPSSEIQLSLGLQGVILSLKKINSGQSSTMLDFFNKKKESGLPIKAETEHFVGKLGIQADSSLDLEGKSIQNQIENTRMNTITNRTRLKSASKEKDKKIPTQLALLKLEVPMSLSSNKPNARAMGQLFDWESSVTKQADPEQSSKALVVSSADPNTSLRDQLLARNIEAQLRKDATHRKHRQEVLSIRDRIKMEKVKNVAKRSLQQAEKAQLASKKIAQVKQIKRRLSRTKNEADQDFVQQGNFVIQQQLKMIVMRNRMKDAEQKRETRILTTYIQRGRHSYSTGRSSSREVTPLPAVLDRTNNLLPQASESLQQEQPSFSTVSMPKRDWQPLKKGAATQRASSLTHGVFAEEYYPIESKTKVMFPPLGGPM